MKILLFLLTFITILLSGCNAQEVIQTNKYKEYKCFDYHLACLDADENKLKSMIEVDSVGYTILYRKPIGESDEKFICSSVSKQHPLSSTELVIMQNPDNYIDVFAEWTIKKIELYCINLYNTIPLWDENEPARTPASIMSTTTDVAVFDELINFVTDVNYFEKYTLKENFTREMPNDDYVIYIRVHFNESDNIIWDSEISSYVSEQKKYRDITIDKGRVPEGIASKNTLSVQINSFANLSNWISTTIDQVC
jgi:hypothetical protein